MPIYLDNHSTTALDPRVFEAMKPFFMDDYGNASSRNHSYGWSAAKAVDKSREQVAKLIGSLSKEIYFTSGATESNNLALRGLFESEGRKKNHIISNKIEHKSVLEVLERLEKLGASITILESDSQGMIDPEKIEKAITPKTLCVSVMAANNEVGTLNPLQAIGGLCKKNEVYFHTDATQRLGKTFLDVNEMNIDLLSLSAHKVHGPKGVGALYIRSKSPRVKIERIIDGGDQELGLRPGTLNVPGIVGLGSACAFLMDEMELENTRVRELRDILETSLKRRLKNVKVNGHPTQRLCNNLNMTFYGAEQDSLLKLIHTHIALSTGSACTSFSPAPSHVLQGIGLSETEAKSTLRMGLGRFTTLNEIERAIDKIVVAVEKIRSP